MSIAEVFAPLGLRISAGPLELHGMTDDLIVELAALAASGIHDPARMPFLVPWTDAPAEELPRLLAQYHWGLRAEFARESWALELAVLWEGQVVGTQGIRTTDFLITRSGETGSWLGRAHQGRGIGTAMRQAICAFAFDCLDFVEITSGAFLDNPTSLAVSRKVGYRPNGVRRLQRRPGELAVNQRLVLTPDTFVRGTHPVEVEGLDAFRAMIGLA